MARNSILGAAAWLILCAAYALNKAALSWIDLLFLFAALVIAPLGLELTGRMEPGVRLSLRERIARSIHLPAAACATTSFFCPRGGIAAGFAAAWLAFCLTLALEGVWRLHRGGFRRLDSACPMVAFLSLPIGGAWLMASRWGLKPLGFDEPIVLLTAIHFHYAGFAAALLARPAVRTLAPAGSQGLASWLVRATCVAVLGGPAGLAAAFLFGPAWKLGACAVLAAGEIGLAVSFLYASRRIFRYASKILVNVAAGSVAFAMIWAVIWAVGEYPLQPFVGLDIVARLHGTANAFGFALCGLWGWTLASKGSPRREEEKNSLDEHRLSIRGAR
jgi:YndJ-like protein